MTPSVAAAGADTNPVTPLLLLLKYYTSRVSVKGRWGRGVALSRLAVKRVSRWSLGNSPQNIIYLFLSANGTFRCTLNSTFIVQSVVESYIGNCGIAIKL